MHCNGSNVIFCVLPPPRLSRLGEELGRGAYGQVYRGLDTRTGQHVAIKQLSLERIPADSLQVRGVGRADLCFVGAACVWGRGRGPDQQH